MNNTKAELESQIFNLKERANSTRNSAEKADFLGQAKELEMELAKIISDEDDKKVILQKDAPSRADHNKNESSSRKIFSRGDIVNADIE